MKDRCEDAPYCDHDARIHACGNLNDTASFRSFCVSEQRSHPPCNVQGSSKAQLRAPSNFRSGQFPAKSSGAEKSWAYFTTRSTVGTKTSLAASEERSRVLGCKPDFRKYKNELRRERCGEQRYARKTALNLAMTFQHPKMLT